MKNWRTLGASWMLLLAHASLAAELYVDPALNAACGDYVPAARQCGAGEYRAFAGLAPGLAALQPGDVLYLREGRYGQLRPPRSGTAERPIEIRGTPGETVTITTDGEVALWLVDRSYIRIANVAVVDVAGFGRLENSTGIVIDHVAFDKSVAGGTTGSLKLVRSSGNRVSNSSFDRGSDLLLLQDDSDRNVITGNSFGRARHSLISVRCSSKNVVRDNEFRNPDQKAMELYDCEGVSDAPVRLDDARRNLVEFNRFLGTAPAGRNHKYNAIQHGGQQNIVRYNLFRDNLGGGVNYQYYDDESLFVYGNRLYNNTFYNNRCSAIIGQRGDPDRFHDNRVIDNLLFQNTDCRGGRDQISLDSGRQVIVLENAELRSDPGFVDAAAGDFHLRAGSEMIDAGAFAATAESTGSGNVMAVDDASWFYDGFGISGETGDLVRIEGSADPVRIVAIDYETNTLTLAESRSWRRGAGVHTAYAGAAPDMGAFEHEAARVP
jgi:hypothetical protein